MAFSGTGPSRVVVRALITRLIGRSPRPAFAPATIIAAKLVCRLANVDGRAGRDRSTKAASLASSSCCISPPARERRRGARFQQFDLVILCSRTSSSLGRDGRSRTRRTARTTWRDFDAATTAAPATADTSFHLHVDIRTPDAFGYSFSCCQLGRFITVRPRFLVQFPLVPQGVLTAQTTCFSDDHVLVSWVLDRVVLLFGRTLESFFWSAHSNVRMF